MVLSVMSFACVIESSFPGVVLFIRSKDFGPLNKNNSPS